jgi:hypothetical protein
MIHSFSKRYIVHTYKYDCYQICNVCNSWQHEFSAFRKWQQSKKRVLKTNESFIVTLYMMPLLDVNSLW